MGAAVSYLKEFLLGKSDYNNNNVPDRKEVIDFITSQLDKQDEKKKIKESKKKERLITKMIRKR